MKLPMYSPTGQPLGDLEVPDEVLAAAALLLDWTARNFAGEEWMLMGLGLVGPHVTRARLDQTNHIMASIMPAGHG